MIVLGDFNANIGCLGGVGGFGEINVQGVLVNDMAARCHLNAISPGSIATGPCHTYVTVVYIFANDAFPISHSTNGRHEHVRSSSTYGWYDNFKLTLIH